MDIGKVFVKINNQNVGSGRFINTIISRGTEVVAPGKMKNVGSIFFCQFNGFIRGTCIRYNNFET